MVKKLTAGKKFTKRENTPLYLKVAEALKLEILSKKHNVGTYLPTEQQLCERFSASRYTTREALRVLENDGMVKRRQGRGTEVISTSERKDFTQSFTSISQIYDYASDTRLVIDRVMRIISDETLADTLGRLPGREWLLVEGVRTTKSDDIICATRVFIHQDFSEISQELSNIKGAIHKLIEDRFNIHVAEVQQNISSRRLDLHLARILGQAESDNSILVTRRYLTHDDTPILVSLNFHPLDGFSYSQTVRRE